MHTTPRLNLLVIRCNDILVSREFYSQLGLSFTQEQHGAGPVHFSASLGDLVIELYPRRDSDNPGLRLGFIVADVPATVANLERAGGRLANSNPVVVISPDDDKLELSPAG